VTLPNGNEYGPIIDARNLNIAGSTSINRNRTQAVPGGAPSGSYTYHAYVGNYPSTVYDSDSFTFEKLTTGYGPAISDWANTGEPFDDWRPQADKSVPAMFAVAQNYPNPFNPTTTISFALPEASHVKLVVYDLQGRMVTELVNSTRDAGVHEVTWDAGDLASGLYFYRITAGDFNAVKKMMLVK